jgi:hypothetical protein
VKSLLGIKTVLQPPEEKDAVVHVKRSKCIVQLFVKLAFVLLFSQLFKIVYDLDGRTQFAATLLHYALLACLSIKLFPLQADYILLRNWAVTEPAAITVNNRRPIRSGAASLHL